MVVGSPAPYLVMAIRSAAIRIQEIAAEWGVRLSTHEAMLIDILMGKERIVYREESSPAYGSPTTVR